MKLPTPDEFFAALVAYEKEPLLPIAACIDHSREMSLMFYRLFSGLCLDVMPLTANPERLQERARALLVLGLNVGIRIGEARR